MAKKPSQIKYDIEYLMPKRIVMCDGFFDSEKLLCKRDMCVSFHNDNAYTQGKGAKIIFDFGREICGGVRIFTREAEKSGAKIRLCFGESLGEAQSTLGEKNATNDHSPRDFECVVSTLSDLSFGQTAFRFVLMEVISDRPLKIQSVYAFCKTDKVKKTGSIVTSDRRINNILKTAQYTLRLNMQKGYIWDGVKRDRLVWSGDLHQEIITSLYCFGNTPNVYNSLKFLREQTPANKWINGITTYSAWWIINICDYIRFYGETEEINKDKEYAAAVLKRLNSCMDDAGNMNFGDGGKMSFFVDWPSQFSDEKATGAASLFMLAAKKYIATFGTDENADAICRKLAPYLLKNTSKKQIRAMQILAGRCEPDDRAVLENGGAAGFSTFMAYYILSAMAKSGSAATPEIIKKYFGGMLSVGATTFFEDFDLEWLNGSGRIDRLPKAGEKDIHGDFGNFCYKGYRHSLCHGWASGVYAFFLENIVGLTVCDGFKSINVSPNPCGIEKITATVPSPFGRIRILIENGKATVDAPSKIKVNFTEN